MRGSWVPRYARVVTSAVLGLPVGEATLGSGALGAVFSALVVELLMELAQKSGNAAVRKLAEASNGGPSELTPRQRTVIFGAGLGTAIVTGTIAGGAISRSETVHESWAAVVVAVIVLLVGLAVACSALIVQGWVRLGVTGLISIAIAIGAAGLVGVHLAMHLANSLEDVDVDNALRIAVSSWIAIPLLGVNPIPWASVSVLQRGGRGGPTGASFIQTHMEFVRRVGYTAFFLLLGMMVTYGGLEGFESGFGSSETAIRLVAGLLSAIAAGAVGAIGCAVAAIAAALIAAIFYAPASWAFARNWS